jgi:nicotinate dehydrogenase subunit A
MSMVIIVNGIEREVTSDPETPLLYVLRNDLGLKGTRFGCGEGTCGACMVLVDGEPVQSCDVPLATVAGKVVRTVEGLGDGSRPHPLQQAFIAEQAAQCGYCTSGILISACALLERNSSPTRHEIGEALDGNLCRCGSHWRVLQAVERAAREMRA